MNSVQCKDWQINVYATCHLYVCSFVIVGEFNVNTSNWIRVAHCYTKVLHWKSWADFKYCNHFYSVTCNRFRSMTFAACVLQTAEMQVYIVFSSIPISITDYRELTAIQANLSDIQVNQPLTSSLFLPKCSLQSAVCKCHTVSFLSSSAYQITVTFSVHSLTFRISLEIDYE